MEKSIYYADAFTNTAFVGNPCAVVLDADDMSTSQMQKVAIETNLNETIFLSASAMADYKMRFFTPHREIPLAGHPVIAGVWLLFHQGILSCPSDTNFATVSLETKAGVVSVCVEQNGQDFTVVMDQEPGEVLSALSKSVAPLLELQEDDLVDEPLIVKGSFPFLLLCCKNQETVDRAIMNRAGLNDLLNETPASIIYLFCSDTSDPTPALYGRFLDPNGTSEDPFSGSLACCMMAYLSHYKRVGLEEYIMKQGDCIGRPGRGTIIPQFKNGEITSVELCGTAALSLSGRIYI